MLRITRLEVKKSKGKYSKSFIAILAFISILAAFSAHSAEVKSDQMFYTVASPYRISDPHFVWYAMNTTNAIPYVKLGEIDIVFDGYMIVSNTDKSFSAADELRSFIEEQFEWELYREYGMDAFPVFVSAEYLKRELAYKPIEKKVMEREEKVEREEWEEEVGQEEITRFIERKEAKIGYTKNKYSTPDDFSPPSLLEKMIYAFFFVIPSYFAIQVFSSSLIEDRIARRIDTVLSTPVSEIEFLLGKMIPYTVFSLIAVVLVSLIFKENILAVIFVLPIILLFSSLQMFLALISRSYREMTFLVTVSSLLLTAYIFIPSVFAGTIPVSKVSPITLMFDFFENEPIEMREYLFATFQFYAMAFVLIYLSSKALNPEIMHSSSDILRRLFMVIERVVRKDYHTFFASIASIPFIFMLEFLLLSVLFILPPKSSIPIFLGIVAFVEESFKGSAVFAAFRNGASLYRAAIFCSLGFFAGEKLIIMLNLVVQYNNLFLAQYLILPLFIHLTSLLLFATIVRRSFIAALIAASFLHFAYNYVVVV